jgi:predicted nuclease with TOPRIM domain
MDPELKQFLVDMREEIAGELGALHRKSDELSNRVDGLSARVGSIDERLSRLESGLRVDLEQLRQELKALVEKTETNLLSEFWKWGRTSDLRHRAVDGRVVGFSGRVDLVEERLVSLEDRISDLERRQAS